MEPVDSDNDTRMSNKRKFADVPEERINDEDAKAKRPRRRRRSHSEPRNTGSDSAAKRDAIRRLFNGYYFQDVFNFDADDEDYSTESNENDDPLYIEDPLLMDGVPASMDPEQLGFLLCAQETLNFLRQSGMSVHHKVYVSLRKRFMKAMKDLGIA